MRNQVPELGSFLPERAWSRLVVELGPMLGLAVPVVVAELGWMMMGVVDTIVVGKLGAEELGAVGLGSNLYMAVAIFGAGLLLGLDTMVAQEHGAGREDEARRSLAQGVYLAVGITPVLMVMVAGMIAILPGWGIPPGVLRLTVSYLDALTWGTLPLLVYGAFRRYLQASDVVKPITVALVTANLVNLGACWALVYGKFGLPMMGVAGSGWATCLARVYLAAALIGAFARYAPRRGGGQNRFAGWPWPEPARLRRLIGLGLPAALQLTLEIGVFAAATALAARLDSASLAAHQIVLTVASLTYMVPLGFASAGAVRVGHALGRRDPAGAVTSGWAALLIGATFMLGSGVALLTLSGPVIRIFTRDPTVIATTTRLFVLAAAFQLFDGIQVVATGVLRGAGETRAPMVCNLVAHWGVGLPVGYLLAFPLGWGITGIWVGLSIGLSLAGVINLAVWSRMARRLKRNAVGSV